MPNLHRTLDTKYNDMSNNKIVVAISQGDTNGTGYEVIIKTLSDIRILDTFTPVIYGSSKAFGFYKKLLHNLESPETYVISSAKDAKPKAINIVNCLPEDSQIEPGKSTPDSAKAAIKALDAAVADIKAGYADVLVTAPINKKAMAHESFGYTGHTDYLKNKFGAEDIAMIMVSDNLKLGIVTGHIPVRDVPAAITKERILGKLRMMRQSLRRDFGMEDPKIGVLGLNPHCGDKNLMGAEEENIILPAVQMAQEEGIMAYGPYSADGYFGSGSYSLFDATLAMYHDQGLAPFKALAFDEGVNFTAGLPIVRTSPDHGVDYAIAGRDEANPQSMKNAIYAAIDIFRRREQYLDLQEGRMKERQPENSERPPRPGKPQIA